MNSNDIHEKLMEIIEDDDCPSYAKVMAMAVLETRKELCYLKRLNKWQIGLIVSILVALITSMFR